MNDQEQYGACSRDCLDACTIPVTARHGRFVSARGENDGCSGRGGNGGVKTRTPTEPRDAAVSAFSVTGGNAEGGGSFPLPARASEPLPVPRRSVKCSRNRLRTSIRRHLGAIRLLLGLAFAGAMPADALHALEPPSVFINANVGSVTEGTSINVTIYRTHNFGEYNGEMDVQLEIDQVGDFLQPASYPVKVQANFAAGDFTDILSLPTVDDQTEEANGSVSVRVLPPEDVDAEPYLVNVINTATVAVLDDEELPLVSIAPVAATVTEGTDAQFRIRRTGPTSASLSVGVEISGHSKMMSDATRQLASAVVTIDAGMRNATLALTTEADNHNEGDGEITVDIVQSKNYQIDRTGTGTVLVEDDDIPEVTLEWVSPPVTLEGNVWVGEIVEGQDIFYQANCSGDSIAPPTNVDGSTHRLLRIVTHHEEILNHPHHSFDRVHDFRAPCSNDPAPWFGYSFPHSDTRWTGANNGEIRIDLSPQVLNLDQGPSFGRCFTDTSSGSPVEERFCPKYTIGAVSSARITVLNRNPKVTIEANGDEVVEGEAVRFTISRHWDADLLRTDGVGGTTAFDYRLESKGGYSTPAIVEGTKVFPLGETEMVLEIPTAGDDVDRRDGEVTLEILPGSALTQSQNVDGHYEVYDQVPGVTPPGKNSRIATVGVRDDDTRGVEVTPTALTIPEGGDATYTIVLESEPTGTVTVTPYMDGDLSVTWSPPILLFTPSDWDQGLLVTVSAGHDVDGESGTATVSHAVFGADYGSVTADDVAVTIADDETASTTVELTVSSEEVDEDAGATSVTVTGTLNEAPRASATIVTVSVGANGDPATQGTDYAPVADLPLTIDAAQTSGTTTFRLTPVDDDLDEADEALTVAGTTMVPGLGVTGTTVTIADDDTRGVEVTPTSLTVPEGGDATYTVVLESEPTVTVTVTPSVSGSSDVTVSPSPLTFTPSDWDEARTVTVSAGDDGDAEADTATVSHAVSGAGYGSVPADEVAVTVADDDAVSTTVELSVSLEEVDEDAGATSVTVTGTLNGASRASATIVTVSVGATGDAATQGTDYAPVAGLPLTIDAGQTRGTTTFTLTPVDDDLDEADEALTVAGTTMVPGLGVTGTTVTIADDDTRGVEVTPTSLTVPEGGDATYTVVLESEPTVTVTVTPSVSGSSDVTVSPSPLTFTPSDWDEARTVTVSAGDDGDAEADTATVSHAVSGAGYGSVPADEVAVTVADDETASTTVELTVSLEEVDEDAGATSVTVTGTLNGAPRASVTIVTVSVGATGDAATQGTDYAPVAGLPLTIDAGQTRGTRTFTLTPVDDDLDEADEALTVAGTTMVPGLGVTGTTVTIADDDTRGVEVTPTSLTVPEGSDSTYTVVLESEPTGTVTVTPSVSGSSDVTVSPSPLTFTPSDWDEARTVTVSAGHDVDAEADTATVSHAVSGADYGSVTADDVAVTIADDETASTTVELTVSSEEVDEDAGATSVTVTGTLNGAPRASATIVTVSVGATEDAATQGTDYAPVAGLPLTIDAGQTSGATTFTLTPVDDDLDEADEALTVAGTAMAPGLGVTGTTVTIADDDTRGVEVTPTSLTVPEGGDATYTVVLESEPTVTVTVTPSVSGSSDVTVSPSPLTFTPSDWDEARTVTVSAGDDGDAEADTATVSHAVSGAGYGSVPADEVAVTVADDDAVSTTVELSVSLEEVDEDAGATSVTVTGTLNGASRASATIVTVSVGATGDAATQGTDYAPVAGLPLTIDAGQTRGTTTFTLTPVDDDLDEADEALTVAGTTMVPGLGVTGTTVTIADDDTRGVEVTPTSLTVPEGGDATYTVVLESEPTVTVTVTPSVSGSSDVTVSPSPLTFTPSDWDEARTVTVSAGDDGDAEADTATVSHAVSGAGYGSVPADEVAVTVADDDTASTTVELAVSSEKVDEDAGATSVTVTGTLNGAPRASATSVTVSVGATGDPATQGTDYAPVADLALTIDAGQTSGATTFTLTPVDDDLDEADEALTVAGTTMVRNLGVTATTVTIADDDTRGVEVTPTSLTVPEGSDSTYTVVLESEPTGTVTVTPSVSGSSDVTVSPSPLTFTPSDWDEARTVTVSAGHDVDAEPDTATVSHAVSGAGYGSVPADEVAVTVADDDTASTTVELTVSLEEVDEDAGATSVTVTGTLNGASRASATIVTVSVGATGDAATEGTDYAPVAGLPLTIDAGQTRGTTTFTLTPVDDDLDEADEALTVAGTTMVPGLGVTGTTVTIADIATRGIVVRPTSLTVPEGSDSIYTVVLESEPTGTVTVTPSVSGSSDVTVSPSPLTFTPSDWDEARTVTVSAGHDVDAEPDTATVSHAVSGADYGSVPADDVAVAVTEDDAASSRVTLTVNPESVDESAGETSVTVTGTFDEAPRTFATIVTVSVGATGDTAFEGTDYSTVDDFTLTIAANETSGIATFMLTPVDDPVDEEQETITVSGTTRDLTVDAAALTIVNDDPLPQAWLARFGRTTADQVIDAVQSRMDARRLPGAQATLAGQPVGGAGTLRSTREREANAADERLADWFAGGTDPERRWRTEERELTAHEMLTGTSFAFTEGAKETGYLTFWGRGAQTRFDGRVGDLSLDGEVTSAMLGTDWARDAWTAGLIVSQSRGEGGYRSVLGSVSEPGGNGEISSSLTGVYPWGRYQARERVTFWGAAGYGAGALTLRTGTGAEFRTDMDLAMAAVGLRGVLVEATAAGGLDLAAKADSLVVRTRSDEATGAGGERIKGASGEVTRVRLGLEGSRTVDFGGDATLTPRMEIGLRRDGGDAETGFGMDIGAGLAYADPATGLTAELRGRGLLRHAAPGFRERGFAGSLGFDPTPDSDRGATFSLRQTMGASATGGMDALLGRDTLVARPVAGDDGNESARRRVEARLGYGLAAYGDRFTMTPEIGYGMSETGRDWSLGWRLTPAGGDRSSFELKLEATRREHAEGDVAPEHGVGLRLTARW